MLGYWALYHYYQCRKDCICKGCKKGAFVTLYLAFFHSLSQTLKTIAAWADRRYYDHE